MIDDVHGFALDDDWDNLTIKYCEITVLILDLHNDDTSDHVFYNVSEEDISGTLDLDENDRVKIIGVDLDF